MTDPGEQQAVSFGLRLVDGRGVLTLGRPACSGPFCLDQLEMEVPGLRFPFDLSEGAAGFRHRRCKLERSSLGLLVEQLLPWLRKSAERSGMLHSNLELHLSDTSFALSGLLRHGADEVPFLWRGLLEPIEERKLALRTVEIWVFGVLPVAAPCLARELCSSLGARPEPSSPLRMSGCGDLVADPLALMLRETLPRAGWRLPALRPVQLVRLALQDGRLELEYGAQQAPLPRAVPAEREQRWLARLQAQRNLAALDELLLTQPDQALPRYYEELARSPDDKFVQERILQLLVASPEHEEQTLLFARQCVTAAADFIPALLAEAAIQLRRRQAPAAAALYRRIADLCAAEGDALGERWAVLTAGLHAASQDSGQACFDFERALRLDQTNVLALGQLARLYADAGAWAELVQVRERQLSLAATPEARLHTYLALGELSRVHLREPQQAQHAYRQALEVDQHCEAALRGLAEACIDADQLTEAVEALDRLCAALAARQDIDGQVALHLRIASLLEHLGRQEAALQRVRQAQALRPESPELLRRVATLLDTMGREREAAELLAQLVPLCAGQQAHLFEIHRELATRWLALGELATARLSLEQALALAPLDAGCFELAKTLAERTGEPEALAEALEHAISVEQDQGQRAELLLRLAQLCGHADHLEQAASALKRALAAGLNEAQAAPVLHALVEGYQRLGDDETAARLVETVAEAVTDPQHRAAHLFAAGQLWQRETGRADEAIRCYRAALSCWPQHAGALDALESLWTSASDRESLAEVLRQKVAIAGRRPAARKALLVRLGELLCELGHNQQADEAFSEALSLDSSHVPALLHLARSAMAANNLERAEQHYRRLATALSRGANSSSPAELASLQVEAHLQLARISQSKGRVQEEEGHLEMALSVDPRHGEVLELLDQLLSKQQRHAELAELLRRRCELQAGDREQRIALELRRAALLQALPGHSDEAALSYRHVLKLEPAHVEALQQLTRLLHERREFGELARVLAQRAELAEENGQAPEQVGALWLEAARVTQARLNDAEGAARCLLRAMRQLPGNPEPLDLLLQLPGSEQHLAGVDPLLIADAAALQRQQGRPEAARRALRALLQLAGPGPARTKAARELLELATDAQASTQQADRLAALLILRDEDAQPAELWQLALCLSARGQHDEAIAVLRRLPADCAEQEQARALLREELSRLERHVELAEELEREAQRQPTGRTMLLLEAGRVWAEKARDLDRAEAVLLEAALSELPEGDTLEQIGDLLAGVAASARFDALVQRLVARAGDRTPAVLARLLCRAARVSRRAGATQPSVEKNYQQALLLEPACQEAIEGLVQLYRERADHEQLVEMLFLRAERAPDVQLRVAALLEAAELRFSSLDQPCEALSLLKRAQRLRPEEPQVLQRLADLHVVLGEHVEAETALTEMARFGIQAEQSLERAFALARLRSDTQAELRHLTRLCQLRPADPLLLQRLAEVYEAEGAHAELASTLERLASTDGSARLRLARLYAGPLANPGAARDTLLKLLAEQPHSYEAIQVLVELLEQLKRPLEALPYLQQIVAVAPAGEQRARLVAKIAALHEESGDLVAAETAWRSAFAELPYDGELLASLVHCLLQQQRFPALASLLAEQLQSHHFTRGRRQEFAELLGRVYLEHLEDPTAALPWLREACTLALEKTETFHRLAALLRKQQDHLALDALLVQRGEQLSGAGQAAIMEELGQLREVELKEPRAAAEAYLAAFRADPHERAGCALRAGELLAGIDALDDALAVFNEVIPHVAESQRSELLASRARLFLLNGMTAEAVADFEHAVKIDPQHYAARAELGRQLMELGRFDAAVPHLRAAAEHHESPKEQAACAFLVQRALEKLELGERSALVSAAPPPQTPQTPPQTPPPQTPPQTPPIARIATPASLSIEEFAAAPLPLEELAAAPLPLEELAAAPLPLEELAAVPDAASPVVPLSEPTTPPDMPPAAAPPPAGAAEEGEADNRRWQEMADNLKAQASVARDSVVRSELLIKAARITEDQLNRPLEAMKLLETAVVSAPEYIEALDALADAAYRNQDWHRARGLYERLAQQGSLLPPAELCYRRALIHEALGDLVTADSWYAQAIRHGVNHRAALEGRARVALWREDVPVAIEALSRLAELISVDEVDALLETRIKLGELHLLAGTPGEAKEYLEAALALDPQQKKVMQILLTVYQQLGEHAALARLLDQLICATSNALVRASLLHYRAEVLGAELDDEEAAIDCLLKAYDLAPGYPPTLWRLIDYYWEKDDLASVAEMGDHLWHATEPAQDPPDSRHVRLAVAAMHTAKDATTAAYLFGLALSQEELLLPALLDLARALTMGVPAAQLGQLLQLVDREGKLRRTLPLAQQEDADTPGLAELAQLLQRPPSES